MPQFDFAILGAGALGSIVGAHLARAGHSVVMLVRENRARQIGSSGLRIQGLSDFTQAVPTLIDTSALDSARVLIVAMKTYGTAEALVPLRKARIDTVFSLQNGVAKNELLTTAFGSERVLGSLANTSGEMLPSGEVLFTRNVNLLLGSLPGHDGSAARVIAAQIDATGVRSAAVNDIVSLEWSKFAAWAGYMFLAVTMRTATWKFLVDPDSAVLLAKIIREAGVLAAASGVQLSDDSLLPIASMCRGTEQQAVETILRHGQEFKARTPDHRISALQDLEAGRGLEVEDTLGYAVRRATALGLTLPMLEASYRLVAAIDRNRS